MKTIIKTAFITIIAIIGISAIIALTVRQPVAHTPPPEPTFKESADQVLARLDTLDATLEEYKDLTEN